MKVIKITVVVTNGLKHFTQNKPINKSQNHWKSINNFFTNIVNFIPIKTKFKYNKIFNESFLHTFKS